MRLGLPLTALLAGYFLHRLNNVDICELVGHDTHWPTPDQRVCKRCATTWGRQERTADLGQTTSSDGTGAW